MTATNATIPTSYVKKYMTQICKHWSHKFEVSLDEQNGSADLPGGLVRFVAKEDSLEVELTPKEPTNLPRMKDVVADHLNRFAFREAPLPIDWS